MNQKKDLKRKPEPKFPAHSRDLHATQGMLQLVRGELKSDIRGISLEVTGLKSEVSQLKSEVSQLKTNVSTLGSELYRVGSEVFRIGVLVEEQNSRNRIVLEGLTGLFQRQDRLELRFEETDNLVRSIAARSRR